MSITEVTGIREIETLYLQLLFRCNFSCAHCFHGENLKRKERISRQDAAEIMQYFVHNHRTSQVVLLGGEPFLHSDIADITADAHNLDLRTEICTNGHGIFRRKLPALVGRLDHLRVSLDGLQPAHDEIRTTGSFYDAIETIEYAVDLGFRVGVTMTITSLNVDDLPELVDLLADRGVASLKLHQLRLVGNARRNAHLELLDAEAVKASLNACSDQLPLQLDDDLLAASSAVACGAAEQGQHLDRIEMTPAGGLTMSCKAVGKDAHAFVWDFTKGQVAHRPTDHDEVLLGIPQVNYVAKA
ncbi:radical SAM protein [Amycolatopsis samaneae]|uniref:Radical SAM protein n=1 Tax=Amycolatopsis samaneae TaxID=664691 RepID=A0ABW5GIA7_9PSEU